jgi:hypothetical protein
VSEEWRPHPGQQERFLASSAFEALTGGQAGGGKTSLLLMEALRQIGHPQYTARIFRRIFTSLEGANGLVQRSLEWYPAYGGVYNSTKHHWTFPSGAKIYFSHLQHEDDKFTYQGDEICYLAFDELTEFTETQYLYLLTRVRAPAPGLRAYVRAATNPGQAGHYWVKERFITRDIVNQLRYFARVEGKDTLVDSDHPGALSRAFYPAAMSDNPSVDPNYAPRILATGDPVLIARLLYGDWDAEHTEGRIYDTWSLDNISAEAAYDLERPVYWGVDDGYVEGQGPGSPSYHPRVIEFCQDTIIGGVNVFDEYLATGESYDETIRYLLEKPYRRPDVAWIDGSAAMFRAELGKAGIMTANGTHRVTEGIKNVRRLLLDGNGMRLIKVNPVCKNLIFEMANYRTDPKARAEGGELIPLKVSDHSCDGLRYALWHKRWQA